MPLVLGQPGAVSDFGKGSSALLAIVSPSSTACGMMSPSSGRWAMVEAVVEALRIATIAPLHLVSENCGFMNVSMFDLSMPALTLLPSLVPSRALLAAPPRQPRLRVCPAF